jgi:hypothetical protein
VFTGASTPACYSQGMNCPRCASTEIRRSQRRGLETLLSWIGFWPFRCERCDARFLRFTLGTQPRLHA